MELRYGPVVAALPPGDDPVCEIGSGHGGLAHWVSRPVIGIDPRAGDDGVPLPANLRELSPDGATIPLDDQSVAAAVAVDTFEHIPAAGRERAITEMKRVVRPGGRVIIIGPTGPDAARGDHRVLELHRRRAAGRGSIRWLEEHERNGLPDLPSLLRWVGEDRVRSVCAEPIFNLRLWHVMHLAAIGALPRTGPLHPFVWAPFGALARRMNRPPTYRQLVVAKLE
jgi:SAM-dependent methyltransferase